VNAICGIHNHRLRASFGRGPSIALLVLAISAACTAQSGPSLGAPGTQPDIPPIDLAAPERLETATFALG
jgi:hypothetical protein